MITLDVVQLCLLISGSVIVGGIIGMLAMFSSMSSGLKE